MLNEINSNSINKYIEISENVQQAQKEKKAVVAIETAGTFEGFSYPANMQVAKNLEDIIRKNGAEPAFIAVIKGKIKIGLTEEEKLEIANPPQPLIKASRRDIPILIAKEITAITSVASSMMLANLAGIHVVAAGGIGGVHRDFIHCFDISADLEEFTKSNIILVCSGAKSILDLPFTMEYLETKAVPVIGYQTDELPAYLSKQSGIKLDYRMDTPEEIAKAFSVKNMLGLPGGLLIANPIPSEYSVDSKKMESAIDLAVKETIEAGIHGKTVTKHILTAVQGQMGDGVVQAGKMLNYSNAELAAKIAVELQNNLHNC